MTAQPHALAVAGAAVGTTTTSVFGFLPITRGATLTSSQLSYHARRAGHNTPWRPQRRDMTPNVTPEAPRATLCCHRLPWPPAACRHNNKHAPRNVPRQHWSARTAYTAKAATTRDGNTHTRGGLGTAQLLLGVWPRRQLGATAERRCVLEANSAQWCRWRRTAATLGICRELVAPPPNPGTEILKAGFQDETQVRSPTT